MAEFTEGRLIYALRRFHDLTAKALVPSARKFLPKYPRFAVIPGDYLGISIIGNGIYERREIELLKLVFGAHKLGTTVFFDIGGNLGNHSVALSASFAEVVAFEPNPPMASLFKTNMLLAGALNVRLHEVGLGREDAELSFGLIEDGNDGSGSFVSGKGDKTLPVRHGDAYVARHEPDIASGKKRIGFVKCDVEGFEAEVFGGLQETLRQHKPIITFESNRKSAGDEAWAELRAAGYDRLHILRETGDDGLWIVQELKRFAGGYKAWLEPTASIPDRRCNLVASVGAID